MSRHKLKLALVGFVAFVSGMFTHAKIHAKPIKVEDKKIPVHRSYVRTGKASWYSKQSPGINHRTANNEVFNDRDFTAAMWGVPFDQIVKVTNRDNGKSVIVRVNDRGPHERFVRKGRVIDLTKEAFAQIGLLNEGLIEVDIEFL